MYYNPFAQNYAQPTVAQKHEVIRVNGKGGADAFQMAPNSQVLLLDESAPIVWLKTTDGAGYPTVTAYNITPAQTEEQKEQSRYDALEKRIAELEAFVNESNNRTAKSKQARKLDTNESDI